MVKLGFLPVTAFASLPGIATLLHWDRFNHSHISFYTWALLYFTTPFLVLLPVSWERCLRFLAWLNKVARWSAARIILEAQAFSIAMILVATARTWNNFNQANPLTWFFVGGLSFLLVALAVLYASIEIHRRNAVKGHSLSV